MNRIESLVHGVVGGYPWLRLPIVYFYQTALSIFPSADYIPIKFSMMPGYFFGFHDKCPWSSDNSKLLAHKCNSTKSLQQARQLPVQIGYFNDDFGFGNFMLLAETSAWNWQQGSSLQWMGNSDLIIYNDIACERNLSIIVDVDGRKINEFPVHIASVSNDGKLGTSINFQRLGIGMPGYGYEGVTGSRYQYQDSKCDGMTMVNFENSTINNIISITDILDTGCSDSYKAFNFLSHCVFSSDNSNIAFFYRWITSGWKMETRLYNYNLSNGELKLMPGADHSHIAWRDNDTLVSYCKLDKNRYGFHLIDTNTGSYKTINNSVLSTDGHPNFTSDGRRFVVDSYPDRKRKQSLMIYDFETGNAEILLKLRIPLRYRSTVRCDYHPRWDRLNSAICFDSAHSGTRSLCVMKLADLS